MEGKDCMGVEGCELRGDMWRVLFSEVVQLLTRIAYTALVPSDGV